MAVSIAEMDEAKAMLAELQMVRDEHQRALDAAQNARRTLDRAMKEYQDARATEQAAEDEMAQAGELLASELQSLDVNETAEDTEEQLAPRIASSLVEYHANIGCYQCYLFLEGHKNEVKPGETAAWDVAMLRVRVDFPRVEVAYGDDADVVWTSEIERNVDVSQCVVEDKRDHWYLRLPIRPSDKQRLGGFSSFTQVSAAELHPESYTSVCCRSCDAQLIGGEVSTTSFEKVLPLPSANWMDMFDFWGAGIGAFEHIPRDNIHAQQRRVLVGESYVLVHGNDFLAGATVADSDGKVRIAPGDNAKEESEWMALSCASCSKRIGLWSVEQQDTIRLHKHLISARPHSEGQEEDIFGKYTIDSILSAKLLEMADSDGVFRFILTPSSGADEEGQAQSSDASSASPPPAPSSLPADLQLQLLSWETMIRQQDANKFRRVLKVLYIERQAAADSKPLIPGILPSHEVTLPPAMCTAIAERLQTSSTLLPPSLRVFNRLNVGYLFA